MDYWQAYVLTQLICAGILLLLYSATLYKVITTTKFKLVVMLLCLLIVSTVAEFVVLKADSKLVETEHQTLLKSLQSAFFFIRDATFNLAYWLFAWQYFTIARNTPYLLKQQTPPEEMTVFDNKINVVMSVLNIIVPLVAAILLLLVNIYSNDAAMNTSLDVFLYLNGVI